MKNVCVYIMACTLLSPVTFCAKESNSTIPQIPYTADVIDFSGYQWSVKYGPLPMGPGPNYFSRSSDNVQVDAGGRLHMRITRRLGRWQCAEVILDQCLGYGKYIFYLDGSPDRIDKNVVLGLFTWDDDAPPYYREIDVEISRWGSDLDDNTQFVVQPWDVSGNMHRFNTVLTADAMTCSFLWTDTKISFECLLGHSPAPPGDGIIAAWEYSDTAFIPAEGQEKVHINLWLCDTAPSDRLETEVVIAGFEFIPL
jgi:hypothetical protein